MKLHNTLTRKLEDFKTLEEGKVKMYQCGPTVYFTQHIGNMRAMFVGDTVRRVLQYLGYDVTFVRNYTDVGHLDGDNAGDADSGTDRMEKGAAREGLTVWQVAEKYIQQFDRDVAKLGNLKPDFSVKATDTIQTQIDLIKKLLEKGYAYITDRAVYFDVSKAKDYTRLSGQKLDENITGAGHGDAEDPQKKHPYDFALWFFKQGDYKNHSMHWPSPFTNDLNPDGDGFPGWHIECSAIIKEKLGDTIDIHIGGIEHIPTHHTNEIAQSENANDKPFVNYWLHNEHLLVDGKKMSKSEGTGFSIEELEQKGFSGQDLRYFFLNAHYRSQQNFTWDVLKDAKLAREKLVAKFLELKEEVQKDLESDFYHKVLQENQKSKAYEQKFIDFINLDFNITGALSVIWLLLKDETLSAESKFAALIEWDKVFGLNLINSQLSKKEVSKDLEEKILEKINARNLARKEKNYALADQIRQELTEMGVDIEDTSEGTEWKIK